MVRWGLVPRWSRESRTKYSTINARIESVAEKPAYRESFRHRRCLVPADGFYEWRESNGTKTPCYIALRDGAVFAFAGLWDRWEGEDGVLESCTIIVMPANPVMQPIHARMPAIVDPECYTGWLDRGITQRQEIMRMLQSRRSGELESHPVSNLVNSPVHDDIRCIQAIEGPA